MPTLYNWLQSEYNRLAATGKSELADRFETFRMDFFAYNYQAVVSAIPDLCALTTRYDEPGIRVSLDYYRASFEAYWLGNLTKGLDWITQCTVQARQLWGVNAVLELYVRLSLLHAWLDTDGPGYADQVMNAVIDMPAQLPDDIRVRVGLLEAYTLMARGDGQQAHDRIQTILPSLGYDWPAPYLHAMRADALMQVERYVDARSEYLAAAAGFEADGQLIDAIGMRTAAAGLLIEQDFPADALRENYANLSAARRLPNQAHIGVLQGAIGRALIRMDDVDEALSWYDAAVQTLDGLGWHRTEAELALERLDAARSSRSVTAERRADWQRDAGQRIAHLRSSDLQEAFRRMSDGT